MRDEAGECIPIQSYDAAVDMVRRSGAEGAGRGKGGRVGGRGGREGGTREGGVREVVREAGRGGVGGWARSWRIPGLIQGCDNCHAKRRQELRRRERLGASTLGAYGGECLGRVMACGADIIGQESEDKLSGLLENIDPADGEAAAPQLSYITAWVHEEAGAMVIAAV